MYKTAGSEIFSEPKRRRGLWRHSQAPNHRTDRPPGDPKTRRRAQLRARHTHLTHQMPPTYRCSGHETFPCRYAWLPKAAQAVAAKGNQEILTSAREAEAMVQLGVGKNMVRSIRFWAEAAEILEPADTGHELTEFGRALLVGNPDEPPLDPYLEDIQTLWLIHWRLGTNEQAPVFSWDFLLNQFQEPELYASAAHRAFRKAATSIQSKDITPGSLEQLYEVFIHSYVPTRGQKGEVREDNLDCPLVELDLLRPSGFTESSLHKGRIEPKYVFRREDKPDITPALFAYCLDDFWGKRFPTEQSIPLHIITTGHGSPGQIFKIPEQDIRSRLLGLQHQADGKYRFDESAAIPRVLRQPESPQSIPLSSVYQQDPSYA